MNRKKPGKHIKSAPRNVAANLTGRVWSMVSIYIFIPLYIHFLGVEAFGLIAFFATLQTVMNILGMGLSKTLRRVFASGEDTDKMKLYKYQMMRSVEFAYSIIALTIILVCATSAHWIALNWLNVETLDINAVALTIRLMGASIGLQILTSLYSGCLYGLEYQVKANGYQIGWSFVKNVGAIVVLWVIFSDIRLLYAWFVIIDFIYLLVLRKSVVGFLKGAIPLRWSTRNIWNIKEIWRYAVGIAIISFVYVINTQLDKAIISKYLTLNVLGAYNVAYTLGNLTSIVASAVAITVFSRFTSFHTTNQDKALKSSFIFVNKAVSLSVVALGTFIAIYSNEIIQIWTGSTQIADLVKSAAFFVVIGSTFLSLQIIPYEFMLSIGNTKVNTILSVSSIPYVLIVTPLLIIHFGIYGAAISWCIQMVVTTTIYCTYVYKNFIEAKTFQWLMFDAFLPFLLSMLIAYASKQFIDILEVTLAVKILYAIAMGGITTVILYGIFDRRVLLILFAYLKNPMKRGI